MRSFEPPLFLCFFFWQADGTRSGDRRGRAVQRARRPPPVRRLPLPPLPTLASPRGSSSPPLSGPLLPPISPSSLPRLPAPSSRLFSPTPQHSSPTRPSPRTHHPRALCDAHRPAAAGSSPLFRIIIQQRCHCRGRCHHRRCCPDYDPHRRRRGHYRPPAGGGSLGGAASYSSRPLPCRGGGQGLPRPRPRGAAGQAVP